MLDYEKTVATLKEHSPSFTDEAEFVLWYTKTYKDSSMLGPEKALHFSAARLACYVGEE